MKYTQHYHFFLPADESITMLKNYYLVYFILWILLPTVSSYSQPNIGGTIAGTLAFVIFVIALGICFYKKSVKSEKKREEILQSYRKKSNHKPVYNHGREANNISVYNHGRENDEIMVVHNHGQEAIQTANDKKLTLQDIDDNAIQQLKDEVLQTLRQELAKEEASQNNV